MRLSIVILAILAFKALHNGGLDILIQPNDNSVWTCSEAHTIMEYYEKGKTPYRHKVCTKKVMIAEGTRTVRKSRYPEDAERDHESSQQGLDTVYKARW